MTWRDRLESIDRYVLGALANLEGCPDEYGPLQGLLLAAEKVVDGFLCSREAAGVEVHPRVKAIKGRIAMKLTSSGGARRKRGNEDRIDPQIVEAEENFLIDFQFKVQDLLHEKGISRSELAKRAGLSKSRLSQILSAEANPTVRTFARIFHVLGVKVVPEVDEILNPSAGAKPSEPVAKSGVDGGTAGSIPATGAKATGG